MNPVSSKKNNALAEIIRSARREKNYTQIELAKLIGISQSAIALLEGGHQSVSSEIIEKILDILGQKVDTSQFFTKSNVKNAICVNPACLNNQKLSLNGKKVILPTLVKHPCSFCKHCQSDICVKCPKCAALIPNDIATYCHKCGGAWIPTELLNDIDGHWIPTDNYKDYIEMLKLARGSK